VGNAVGGLFDRSADRYDRINTAIIFGQDRRWRRWAARSVVRRPGLRVLDACAGTGLVGLEAARLGARVTLADVSPGMLARARERAAARRLDVSTCLVDLADPPAAADFGDFDGVTLAFGLRYFDDPVAVMRRLAAALRPGGELVLLEAVLPAQGLLARGASFYFFHVAPRLAALLGGRRELYDRLTASVRSLGTAADVADVLAEAGFDVVRRRGFVGGLVIGVVARRTRGTVAG
jgi:demethylmenaquinone methyltransferase/2-methoxy-6-polyprenyl-1,4-benzoquinol methylase